MPRLPDLEAWAVFATVVESGSFSRAAGELGLSKATVSKAVSRLEERLGARLLHRSSHRLLLTETGRDAAARAARIVAEGETMEAEVLSRSAEPRGLVRIAAPMSFGVSHLAPLLPALLASLPQVSIDLHLSDAQVDLVGDGFDLAIRVAIMGDSSLRVRRICPVRRILVGAPAYFAAFGDPAHPHDLQAHRCLSYAYLPTPDRWRFENAAGEVVTVTPAGPLRINNGDAIAPSVLAGVGLAVQPEFIVWRDLAEGRLQRTMPGWSMADAALNLVMPPGGLRPRRVTAVVDFLAAHLAAAPWAASPAAGPSPR